MSRAEPGAWRALRASLDAAGFRPSRRLGQNFLLDPNLARAIVRDSAVGPGDPVLEVGAGLGFLTRHLAEAGADVLAVEVDRRLCELAREELAGAARVRLVCADALAGKHRLSPEVRALLPAEGTWHVVSNLPYSISAPLLVVLSELENPPVTMTVLVQEEVAERIVARPGTSDWGPLSVHLQLAYDARIVRHVPPELFWPRPKVESALVRLARKHEGPAPEERAELAALVAGLFQRRRQALLRVLGDLTGDREGARAALLEIGLGGRERAEDLGLETLRQLARSAAWRARPRPPATARRPHGRPHGDIGGIGEV